MTKAWRNTLLAALCSLAGAASIAPAASQDLQVVTTVRPVHSLAASVMQGVATPRLLVDGSASPHTFVMKPSDAKALANATLLVRVSEGLEPFTQKLIPSLPKQVKVVTLASVPGIKLHPMRTGATFEAHDDAAHGHKGHGHKHAAPKPGAAAAMDGHIWLDPDNAKVIAGHLAEVLAGIAPAHAERFRANAAALATRLDGLAKELAETVKPAAGRSYIVFHDAYQYFERRYGLEPAGSVTISPDVPASAKRIAALRRKVVDLKVVCVFAEPQFAPKLIDPIIESTPARRGTLDPLGVAIPAGPEQYFGLLRALASDLRSCLANPA